MLIARLSLLLLSLLFASFCCHSQTPRIEKSIAFEEPGIGWNKVLQLKNGNTLFFHFTKKEGIEVSVFNKSRALSSTKSISSELWDPRAMRSTIISGLYEINGEAVLFMIQADKRVPTLYRLRFDGVTGDLTKEDEIGSLPKTKVFAFSTESNDIIVEKDPQSDCYAVIFFNGLASEVDDRIKVLHYDGKHKLINIAHYDSPEETFKYLRFIGAVVDADKRLYISVYGSASLKGKDAHVYISKLNVTDSVFTSKAINFTEDFKDTKSVMVYNHTGNFIQLLTLSFAAHGGNIIESSTGIYMSFISCFDPESLELMSVKPVVGRKTNEYVHNVLNLKVDYRGLPQQMVINKDNSTTILSEEVSYSITKNQNGSVVSASTILGAIGINEINPDGTEKNGYVMIKSQIANGLLGQLYISARSKGRWFNGDNSYYLSYDYINADKNRYVLFNDNPKNYEKEDDEKKRRTVGNSTNLNTVCYSLNGTYMNKFYLFGNPSSDEQSTTCHIAASDYQHATNTYATIIIERDGHNKEAKMAWIHFE